MRTSGMVCLLVLLAAAPLFAQELPDWTVMVWMNGDNNLQDHVLQDWKELAAAAGNERVRVVVQLDLNKLGDTRRFRVQHSDLPKLSDADLIGERNMVDGAELADFVQWARTNHTAKKYALIFSSHGDGWRELRPSPEAPAPVPLASVPAPALAAAPESSDPIFLPPGVFGSPNRTISLDDSHREDALYNREIADSLAGVLSGKKLELVIFDACLMGMVEVAYGLRNVANVLVASEELVQNAGMNYTPILDELGTRPAQDGQTLSRRIVTLYDELHDARNRNDPSRTLAAFRLDRIEALATALSELSGLLIDDMALERPFIRRVRARCMQFAPDPFAVHDRFYHVDLKRFVDLLAQETPNPEVKAAAENVSEMLTRARIHHYAGALRSCDYGGEGLAIYFPATREQFRHDPLQEKAYLKANGFQPVEFVQNEEWSAFLHVYFFSVREEELQP